MPRRIASLTCMSTALVHHSPWIVWPAEGSGIFCINAHFSAEVASSFVLGGSICSMRE
jgi:hypothetical protein